MPFEDFKPTRSNARRAATGARRLDSWVEGYKPLPGVPDSFIDAEGRPRAHWLKYLSAMSRMESDETAHRFAAADQRIRDMGISYRVYGETHDRTWPLSRLPLLIDERDWKEISRGIEQRANLLEAVLADCYGEGHLMADGILPASVVAGSPEYLRPMQGIKPVGGRWLNLYAADIGRGPDGRWWVLGDRAQAPSGSGYALENRLVLSRAFPNLYREMNVERLAPFFREFRAGLTKAAERADPRICLLSSGPFSETYFEQAYLARYLGFLLVEGDDLVLHDGRIHVRTIAGLKRADVIWRRVDSDWCDPLELNAASDLGVPGLIEAARNGSVVLANMPGSGLIESRALLSFLPALSRRLLGEDLRLPNIATWWCGQESERDTVLGDIDDMAIAGAFTDGVPGFSSKGPMIGADMSASQRTALRDAMAMRGADFVGQEVVRLSTTPTWVDGTLAPRPFVLRVFAAATPDGWRVMPGGFARISDRSDARALTMSEGVQSADVWVIADRPVEVTTLLPTGDDIKIVRKLGNLPSRAADNLFWLGRYLERVEATLRVVRCLCGRVMDGDAATAAGRQSIERLHRLIAAWGAVDKEAITQPSAILVASALRNEKEYGSAMSLARSARRAASVIRERLSQDAWQLLTTLETSLETKSEEAMTETEALDDADEALRIVAALSGLIQENVNRVAGWNFLDMGRRVERAINTCRIGRQFADKEATVGSLDVVLDFIDSQITYRSRYLAGVALAPVRDIALLDPFNPRSVAFQVARLDEHLSALPLLRDDGNLEAPRRISMRLLADIAAEEARSLDTSGILAIEQRIMALAEAIADRYFLQGPNAARAEKLMGLA